MVNENKVTLDSVNTEPSVVSKKAKITSDTSSLPLSPHLDVSSNFFTKFSRYYSNRESLEFIHDDSLLSSSKSLVVTEPFLAGSIANVFTKKFLTKLKKEVEIQQTYTKKYNDLYEFYQSKDLKSTHLKTLKKARETIYGSKFLDFFSKLTGIELNNQLDVSVSKYIYGNHLLCHDDDIKSEKEGRRIAFIIYLVDEDWEEKDGGALELFSRDQNGQPSPNPTVKLYPKLNQMVFFEIGNHSYHQVAEVTSKLKDRLSIVGWFHGQLPTATSPIVDYKFGPFLPFEQPLKDFINPEYFNSEIVEKIKERFMREGSIELVGFLNHEVYEACLEEIENRQVNWGTIKGPAHVRSYYQAIELPSKLKIVSQLFQSTEFQQLLTSLTNHQFKSFSHSLRQFDKGNYSLLHDHALEPNGLDLILPLTAHSSDQWDSNFGGGLHYIKEDQELMCQHPAKNRLTLVRRTDGIMRFVKYLKKSSPYKRQEFAITYMEV